MELSQLLDEAFLAGTMAWPGVALDRRVFAERLEGLGLDAEQISSRGSDLFLAAACAAQDPVALELFERTYLAQVPRLIGRVALSAHQEDELRQQLRIRLLVGPTPKIAEYRGSGPLGAWVRVCALRLALDLKMADGGKRNDAQALDALVVGAPGGEVEIDAARHRVAFQSALQESLATLTTREKTLLRLHFLDGMNIDELGVVFRVHRATVARWLVAVRTRVLENVREKLSLDLGASLSEAHSLVRLLRSEVQVSIRRILDEEPRSK
jgi:RNA polymerase sigma-70 factor (ECF subfamily)